MYEHYHKRQEMVRAVSISFEVNPNSQWSASTPLATNSSNNWGKAMFLQATCSRDQAVVPLPTPQI
jgi:hypothetical protein